MNDFRDELVENGSMMLDGYGYHLTKMGTQRFWTGEQLDYFIAEKMVTRYFEYHKDLFIVETQNGPIKVNIVTAKQQNFNGTLYNESKD